MQKVSICVEGPELKSLKEVVDSSERRTSLLYFFFLIKCTSSIKISAF